jgi:cholesterol transport system auxiliary component
MKCPFQRIALCLTMVTALVGCQSLLVNHEPAATVYSLRVRPAAALTPQVNFILTVQHPYAGPELDSDRIVVMLTDRRLDVLAGARWSAPLADLLQTQLIESLRARGGWREVVSDRSSFKGGYLLRTEIPAFSADYEQAGSAPRVRVCLHGELGRPDRRDLLSTFDAHGEAQASANRQSAVVAAFESALADALEQLGAKAHAASISAESNSASGVN